jgi:flagellar basal-body rod modification protein FlgD
VRGRAAEGEEMITSVPKTTFNQKTNQTPSTAGSGGAFALKAQDFIKMMITQLQNQDPMEPAKNEELLAQMSQIGQLQTSTQLQDSLKSMTMQNQIGSASNLIGKEVEGLDAQDDPVKGLVNSVHVEKDNVQLELDNGKTLDLGRVTAITPAHTGTAAAK